VLPVKAFISKHPRYMWVLSYHDIDAFIVKTKEVNPAANEVSVILTDAIAPNGGTAIMEFIRRGFEASMKDGNMDTVHLKLKALNPVGEVEIVYDFQQASFVSADFGDIGLTHENSAEPVTISLTFFYKDVTILQ